MARTVNEKSPLRLTIACTDYDGNPLAPSTLEWRLDSGEDGTQLVDWTNVPGPTETTNVILGATDHAIVDQTKVREARIFGVRVDNGLATEAHEQYQYHVINMLGAT